MGEIACTHYEKTPKHSASCTPPKGALEFSVEEQGTHFRALAHPPRLVVNLWNWAPELVWQWQWYLDVLFFMLYSVSLFLTSSILLVNTF